MNIKNYIAYFKQSPKMFFKAYLYWRKRKKNVKTIDYIMGCGYYRVTRGTLDYFSMESGHIGVYMALDYTKCLNPPNMMKESYWMFIGYQAEKPINACTFLEYLMRYTTINGVIRCEN